MARILFNHVTKRYGKYRETAVDDFNLIVEDGEFLVFVGPSGCGKSTTLRMLAGLEDISEGAIYIGDTKVNDIQPKDRDISMVFQNYALYPNLTVYENIAFGLRVRKMPKHEIDLAVKRAARVLEIENFLHRKPGELSGGQKQRVALGRAIVRAPQAFLMDEPLSNLDARLRVQMRAEIIRLHRAIGVTMIYVTHDQIEAMTMGDRIVVMNRGVIQQVDTPEQVYMRPANLFVAAFIGNPPMNLLSGQLREEEGRLRFCTKRFHLSIPARQAGHLRERGLVERTVVMGLRPEHVSFDPNRMQAAPDTVIGGLLQFDEFVGADRYYHLKIGAEQMFVIRSPMRHSIEDGCLVRFAVEMDNALFFDRDSEALIT